MQAGGGTDFLPIAAASTHTPLRCKQPCRLSATAQLIPCCTAMVEKEMNGGCNVRPATSQMETPAVLCHAHPRITTRPLAAAAP